MGGRTYYRNPLLSALYAPVFGLWYAACYYLIKLSGFFPSSWISLLSLQRVNVLLPGATIAAFFDPMVHIPNLRALNRDLKTRHGQCFAFGCSGHGAAGEKLRHYAAYPVQAKLAQWITPLLEQDEHVYQLSGNDLILRFNTELHKERIEALDRHIKQFRFVWDGMPLQPQVGISFAMSVLLLTISICCWES